MSPPVGAAARLTPEQETWLYDKLKDAPARGVAAGITREFNERFGQNRLPNLVWNFRMRFGLNRNAHRYTAAQEDWLREFGPDFSKSELARVFNRRFGTGLTAGAVAGKRHQLGIPSKFEDPQSHGRYLPGHRPVFHNTKPNSGSFKPGHRGTRTRAAGETRIDKKSGEVLVKLDRIVKRYYHPSGAIQNTNFWKPRRIVVWEREHGPVPPGHVVTRLVDDVTDDRVEVLMCISRAALARLNQTQPIRELPEDLELRRTAVRAAVLRQAAFDRQKGVTR